jgi:hypothetical protein
MIISLPELLGQRMALSREQRDEIRELKIEVAKLGATLAELCEQRAESFRPPVRNCNNDGRAAAGPAIHQLNLTPPRPA